MANYKLMLGVLVSGGGQLPAPQPYTTLGRLGQLKQEIQRGLELPSGWGRGPSCGAKKRQKGQEKSGSRRQGGELLWSPHLPKKIA